MKSLSIALLCLAALTLVGAGHLYSFCIPLESACHMHDVDACARLEATLRVSGRMALSALALALCAFSAGMARRLRQLLRRARAS